MEISQLMGIPISKDPVLKLDRKIYFRDLYFTVESELIRTRWMVKYFSAEGLEIDVERCRPYEKTMIADNTQLVDMLGNLSEDGVLGEYNFFLLAAQYPIDVLQYIYDTAVAGDARGVFNI